MVRSLGEVFRRVEKIIEKLPKPLFRGGSFPKPDFDSMRKQLRSDPLPTTTVRTFQTESGDTPSSIARGFANVVRPPRNIPSIPDVTPMIDPTEALAEVINNPEIIIDADIMDIINDPEMLMDLTRGELVRLGTRSRQFSRENLLPKKKRKVSPYGKEFGRQLKKLKKKFPRTPITKLMKRAHTATRKIRGTKKGQVRKTARRAFKK